MWFRREVCACASVCVCMCGFWLRISVTLKEVYDAGDDVSAHNDECTVVHG